MMGSGGLPPTETTGLQELAALVSVIKDPKAYEEKLGELRERASALDVRKAELDRRKADLDKKEKDVQVRELFMLKRLEEAADQRAQDKVKLKLAQLDAIFGQLKEHLSGIMSSIEKFQEADAKFQASVERAEATVRGLKVAA